MNMAHNLAHGLIHGLRGDFQMKGNRFKRFNKSQIRGKCPIHTIEFGYTPFG